VPYYSRGQTRYILPCLKCGLFKGTHFENPAGLYYHYLVDHKDDKLRPLGLNRHWLIRDLLILTKDHIKPRFQDKVALYIGGELGALQDVKKLDTIYTDTVKPALASLPVPDVLNSYLGGPGADPSMHPRYDVFPRNLNARRVPSDIAVVVPQALLKHASESDCAFTYEKPTDHDDGIKVVQRVMPDGKVIRHGYEFAPTFEQGLSTNKKSVAMLDNRVTMVNALLERDASFEE
jgi:hypothetical protein